MSWRAYRVIFALRSPLHAGYRKLGNLQQTRPYLPAKNLWAALTARMTRNAPKSGGDYVEMGKMVNRDLAFTYFYPTTDKDGEMTLWPWGDGEAEHRYQFLDSYASTALDYGRSAAEDASLHEVECLCPHTRDGQPVYLSGYTFARDNAPDWKSALSRLQVGGERGYGWGRLELVGDSQPRDGQALFGGYTIEPDTWPPVLTANAKTPLPAHALAAEFDGRRAVSGVSGPVEPLVGRETTTDGRFGVRVSRARICYVPGSTVEAGSQFCIGPYGIWEAL